MNGLRTAFQCKKDYIKTKPEIYNNRHLLYLDSMEHSISEGQYVGYKGDVMLLNLSSFSVAPSISHEK